MTAHDAYDRFLATSVVPVLKGLGYRRSRGTFTKSSDDGVAIVEFQKSKDSGRDAVTFTVNIGVAYRPLGFSGRLPKSWDCHVFLRIGSLLPDRSPGEYWWLIDDRTNLELLGARFAQYLEEAVDPFVQRMLTVDGLRRHLEARAARGTLTDAELGWLDRIGLSDPDALTKQALAMRARNRDLSPTRSTIRQPAHVPPLVIETR
jgi:hypothetical protein